MDPYEELLGLARDTARSLLDRGITPGPFRDDAGTAVEGWVVQRKEYRREDLDNPLRWREIRNQHDLVLDVGSDPLRRIPMMEPTRGSKEHVEQLFAEVTTPSQLIERLASP